MTETLATSRMLLRRRRIRKNLRNPKSPKSPSKRKPQEPEEPEAPHDPDTPEDPDPGDSGTPPNPDGDPSGGGGTGDNTDTPGTGEDPGGEGEPGDDDGDDEEDGVITDLTSRTIVRSELEDDTLKFYAYYSDASANVTLKVRYRHADDSGNGTVLRPDGVNYSTRLKLGINYIYITYTDPEEGTKNIQFIIHYEANKATEDNPTVGIIHRQSTQIWTTGRGI